ncbi:MAG: transketolase family protein [Candidatus Heteroscillospira sp.]|jgi:transketolase
MAKSIREYYGQALADLGAKNDKVVVLDADVSNSTRSCVFGAAYPERFFNMGISEANMVATAAGLASTGKIPFINAFAVFLTSLCYLSTRDQICYGDLDVKLVGANCGISSAFDGSSHHSLEDISLMRGLPKMNVIVPCDPASVSWAVNCAAETPGPAYIRLSRDVYPDVYDNCDHLALGKGMVLREGSDATVFACGIMVHKALAAAELLAKEGVSLRVVDMYSIKPIDRELILKCARETGAIITAEEHSVIGGLGSAVAEVLAYEGAGVPVEFVGTQDTLTATGPYDVLMKRFGLDEEALAAAVKRAVLRKK